MEMFLASHGVNISNLIRFARVCSNVDDFNKRNTFLTSNLLNKVIDTTNFLRFFFPKFYNRHLELIAKCNIG